jgi:hypothetical protein
MLVRGLTVASWSINAHLSALSLSAGLLQPGFEASVTSYSVNLTDATVVSVTATAADTNAMIMVGPHGGPYSLVESGLASGPLGLAAGANLLEVIVSAVDPSFVQTYTITATVVVERPHLSLVARAGNAIRFSFNTQAGRPYAIESCTSLSAANWTVLSNIPAQPADTLLSFTNIISGAQGYFRVRCL